MIAIIDYGMGNLFSVEKAFAKLGAEVIVTREPEQIRQADKVVLPGVGAFGDCMKNLRQFQLESVILETIRAGKPFLGICVGLQMLFEGSEEDPGVPGIGVFSGMVKKIVAPELKIPHMGWNDLTLLKESPILSGLEQSFVYFVHSYHAVPTDVSILTAKSFYGEAITAAVGRNNVQAVQFHPEKSGQAGLKILANFKEMTL